ncbi:MAG: 6,7-dimethyl-8-ribityllumazine synthase [Flavobacteriales bacterium]|jgi:6,7-dimethyl-8-ribityllumazine synthase|nr:6,7-dimethyl-8-ribityllumazine synthase [Flavobacteriales bacterium]|tara:strand:- start:1700 stop:2176 length:477 start_codon:yes stop_codon:yes gene_type:complete
MASANQHLDSTNTQNIPSGEGKLIAIVCAEWNQQITSNLAEGAKKTLIEHGVSEDGIIELDVPGAIELTFGAKSAHEQHDPDAVIVIGCVIQGETKHFDYVCQSVTYGITELNLSYDAPTIFCVLTDNTLEQSMARSGGEFGNKGIEAAVAALKMMAL